MSSIHCAQVNVDHVLKGVANTVVLVHYHAYVTVVLVVYHNTIIVNLQGEQVLIVLC